MNHYLKRTCLLAALVPTLALSGQRTDLNSFLDVNVSNTSDLVYQVQSRPDVKDRYLRHYGMTEAELIRYLSTLRIKAMPKSETVTVYSVPGSGELRRHKQRLSKGELVFVDKKGHGALLAKCGNPLASGPRNRKNVAVIVPGLEGLPVTQAREIPNIVDAPIAMADPRTMLAMTIPPDTIADEVVTPPITTAVVTAPNPPLTPAVPPPAGGGGGGSHGGLGGILPVIGGGILAGIILPHHGGGGNDGTPIVPAPEPLTCALLAGGALALARRRRR